jgi:hypothetical protein
MSLRATGTSVGVIDSAGLGPFLGRTLSEALTARIPGVSVMRSSGVAGTGSRVRMRGPSGILLAQQPLLFIDGIRADGTLQSTALSTEQAPSRLDDLAVDDVECVYVLRGPATTARYGTDAAGGIIEVITRRARADSARVHAFLEGGATEDVADYPANFGNATSCTRARAALGQCTSSPIRSWSPLEADSPFRTGSHAHGGGHAMLISARRTALGVNASGTIDDGALRANDDRRFAAGTHGVFRPDTAFGLETDLWLLSSRASSTPVGNALISILNSALLGSSIDDPRRGYRDFPLSVLERFVTTQRVRRVGGSSRLHWNPISWLSVNALAGREDSRVREERANLLVSFDPPPRVLESGVATGELRTQRNSASLSAAASYGSTKTRLTTEVVLDRFTETYRQDAGGRWLGLDFATKGVVVRQALAWSDRRFVELGLRHDVLDQLVERLEKPTYRFANAAWDIRSESFFPDGGVVSSLRIRGAYGESGDSRGFAAAFDLALFSPLPAGSSSWPVERTREIEGGADVGFFGDRLLVNATLFTKRTSDGLLDTFDRNSGLFAKILTTGASWRNGGTELAMRARLVDAALVRADVALTFSTLKNEVTSLGNGSPVVEMSSRVVPGYPLYGTWGQGFSVTDANGDGVIVPTEVVPDTTFRYLGSPVPTRELAIIPSISFGRSVTVTALVDYRGGFRSTNWVGRTRCRMNVCAALYEPNVSMAEQARAADPVDAQAAWVEDASFVRLRELSVAWAPPTAWSRWVGARSSSLVLAGRNLLTSTSFGGLDPEGTYLGQTRIDQQDFFTLALPRTIGLRLALGW